MASKKLSAQPGMLLTREQFSEVSTPACYRTRCQRTVQLMCMSAPLTVCWPCGINQLGLFPQEHTLIELGSLMVAGTC